MNSLPCPAAERAFREAESHIKGNLHFLDANLDLLQDRMRLLSAEGRLTEQDLYKSMHVGLMLQACLRPGAEG